MTVRRLGYQWRLREVMAARGLWQTTDLAPLLAERGIELSSTQVYRLVTQTPERLSLPRPSRLASVPRPAPAATPPVRCGRYARSEPGSSRTRDGQGVRDVWSIRAGAVGRAVRHLQRSVPAAAVHRVQEGPSGVDAHGDWGRVVRHVRQASHGSPVDDRAASHGGHDAAGLVADS